ncbi:hypothetical protein [Phenylobacterium sp.]|uniref:hypothetical protein n=1 Tax=Phenylobacterium sp. TaxID=1871053 RepID=UPI0030F48972
MATVADKVARRVEEHYPHVLGLAGAAMMLVFGPNLMTSAAANGWHLDQLYAALFNLSTVFTGFLFTFYSFVVTADRGFLAQARQSIYLQRANGFTIVAITAGFILCVLSIPTLVWQPAPIVRNLEMVWLSVWVGTSVWALLAFERATRLFIIFASRHKGSQ